MNRPSLQVGIVAVVWGFGVTVVTSGTQVGQHWPATLASTKPSPHVTVPHIMTSQ